jgi:hypothetical protein
MKKNSFEIRLFDSDCFLFVCFEDKEEMIWYVMDELFPETQNFPKNSLKKNLRLYDEDIYNKIEIKFACIKKTKDLLFRNPLK